MRRLLSFFMLLLATQTFAQNTAIPSTGMAKMDKDGAFQKYEFTRHAVGDHEILIDIMYSGICHSDIHAAKGEWRPTKYPFVGGHEIAGHVVKVGKAVTKFKVGDHAGIGCLVNSCGKCTYCKNGQEQFCSKGPVFSYGMPDPYNSGEITQGGYANNYVIAEKFALKIPKNADLKRVAPLLCAGITTYSPIQFSKVKKGDTVAVAGFGGLGHLAVKYLVALGAKVTVFDITEDKRTAAQKMGAVKYVNVNNAHEIKGLESQYSFILSTIPQKYDPTLYIKMLSMGGELAIVGLPATENQPMINGASLVYAARRKVYGSLIGGIPETQQMLDYSVANNIYPDVEIISANQIDEAYQKVIDGKVQFRYVIDMKTLKK